MDVRRVPRWVYLRAENVHSGKDQGAPLHQSLELCAGRLFTARAHRYTDHWLCESVLSKGWLLLLLPNDGGGRIVAVPSGHQKGSDPERARPQPTPAPEQHKQLHGKSHKRVQLPPAHTLHERLHAVLLQESGEELRTHPL